MENKKLSAGPIIALVVGIGMVGSVAMVGFNPMMSQGFAEPSAQSAIPSNGPHVPRASFQTQNGIPLGPQYGSPATMHVEQTIAIAMAVVVLVVGIAATFYFIIGKSMPVMMKK